MSGNRANGRYDLPADLTSLVGRRAEIVEVHRLVAESRLVTLTGVAGVGKTRLAIAAARDAAHRFAAGVRLVELPVVELYRIRDGKLAHADVYYKDPSLFEQLDS